MRDKREERSEEESALGADGSVAKRQWHPPALQEVDVVDTEFGSGSYDQSDSTTYQS